jgi:hypothetical protein
MKSYKLSDLLRDYDFVTRVLENPDNKREHIIPINKLIVNFNLKYANLYYSKHREYFLALSLKLDNLRIVLKTRDYENK